MDSDLPFPDTHQPQPTAPTQRPPVRPRWPWIRLAAVALMALALAAWAVACDRGGTNTPYRKASSQHRLGVHSPTKVC